MSSLWGAFCGPFEGPVPDISPDELRSRVASAAESWPGIGVAEQDVAEALGRLMARTGARVLPSADVVSAMHLAIACSQGHAVAIEAFEERYFRGIAAAVAGLHDEASDLDDLKQHLRTRLFVAAPGDRARVVDAVGHGDLAALVRVAALRLALNRRRGDRRRRARAETLGNDVARLQPAVDTPELMLLRDTHRQRFKEAFEHAISRLSARDRNLLRYHLAEHLNIDEIAAMYGVHRSTAARWLASTRSLVAGYTQERLADLIDDQAALPALFALIRSRLDLSITRIFVEE